MKKKKSVALMIAAILGILYSIYLVSYFGGTMFNSSSDIEAIGGAVATALVTPHMICVALAAIFCLIAAISCHRGLALAGAILYTVGALLFILYGMFVIPMIILSFVGFARLKKINEQNMSISALK